MIASHIVPWSHDTHNRLNPQNGLCLSALHDRAYDQGLMTVLPDDFTIRVSPALRAHDGAPITLPERFRPAPEFLRSTRCGSGSWVGQSEIHSRL